MTEPATPIKPWPPTYSLPLGEIRSSHAVSIKAGGYLGQRDEWQNTRLELERVSDHMDTIRVGSHYVSVTDLMCALEELEC